LYPGHIHQAWQDGCSSFELPVGSSPPMFEEYSKFPVADDKPDEPLECVASMPISRRRGGDSRASTQRVKIKDQVLSWLLSDFKMSRFELDELQAREEVEGHPQGRLNMLKLQNIRTELLPTSVLELHALLLGKKDIFLGKMKEVRTLRKRLDKTFPSCLTWEIVEGFFARQRRTQWSKLWIRAPQYMSWTNCEDLRNV